MSTVSKRTPVDKTKYNLYIQTNTLPVTYDIFRAPKCGAPALLLAECGKYTVPDISLPLPTSAAIPALPGLRVIPP